MSSISGVSGSSGSYFPQTGGTQRRERDTSKIAENVFSKLDTKNQGYLEVSDLESAFGNIASSSSTSTASTSSSGSSTNSTNASINDLFKKLDSDGDGKVTKSEFSDGIKKLGDALETQFNAKRTRGAEGSRPPPPPPPGGGEGGDQGLDKTQLTDLSTEVGKTNSSAGAALSQVAQNFDAADTNQDGKVSLQETLAYLEKASTTQTSSTSTATSTTATASTSNSSTSSSSGSTGSASDGTTSSVTGSINNSSSTNTDAALFKKALQLLRAYSSPPTSSSSQSISVSA
ncbi:EF-hand domain-containing protein [Undibacterium sp. TC4M20W]|uniref:EF-hand domain-containing protein n=1 Tax=unclassified Undibacterium TaxID=2630295 RepID=UPI003BF11F74